MEDFESLLEARLADATHNFHQQLMAAEKRNGARLLAAENALHVALKSKPFTEWRDGIYRITEISPMVKRYEWANFKSGKCGSGEIREKHGFKAFRECHLNLDPAHYTKEPTYEP